MTVNEFIPLIENICNELNELIIPLENIRNEFGNVNVLIDHLDYNGEYESLATHVRIDWVSKEEGARIGCQE